MHGSHEFPTAGACSHQTPFSHPRSEIVAIFQVLHKFSGAIKAIPQLSALYWSKQVSLLKLQIGGQSMKKLHAVPCKRTFPLLARAIFCRSDPTESTPPHSTPHPPSPPPHTHTFCFLSVSQESYRTASPLTELTGPASKQIPSSSPSPPPAWEGGSSVPAPPASEQLQLLDQGFKAVVGERERLGEGAEAAAIDALMTMDPAVLMLSKYYAALDPGRFAQHAAR